MYLFSQYFHCNGSEAMNKLVWCNRKYYSALYAIRYLAAIIKRNPVVINNLERASYAEMYGIRIHITLTLKS